MPQLVEKYVAPLLDALKSLGGSARPPEVYETVARDMKLQDRVLDETNKDGRPKFENQIAWARLYLVRTGYLDKSKRGVWALTQKGRDSAALSPSDVEDIVAEAQRQRPSKKDEVQQPVAESAIEVATIPEDEEEDSDYRRDLLDLLLTLPPNGFERLCQRLLRESGFEQVNVIGRTGDGGIDGIGILRVNPFVNFRVSFQCKRYSKPVGSPQVRDFRGAIVGRADKGIILTTSSFTADARREAERDGATPIELVDGFQMVELFEKLELGLVPRRTFDIDSKFFDEFKS